MELQELFTPLNLQTRAWEKDNCFQSLVEHRRKGDLDDIQIWLCNLVENLGENTQFKYEWSVALCLTACTRLSTLEDEHDPQTLRSICKFVLNPLFEIGIVKPSNIYNSLRNATVNSTRGVLDQYEWPFPLNPSWAWDAIRQLRGFTEPVCQEEIVVLLYDGYGFPARLQLESFPGVRPGIVFFPDPRYMSFVHIRSDFNEAFEIGTKFAWSLVDNLNNPSIEVRWRIIRDNDEPLTILQDQSIGAAFGLCLAKLVARHVELVTTGKSEAYHANLRLLSQSGL